MMKRRSLLGGSFSALAALLASSSLARQQHNHSYDALGRLVRTARSDNTTTTYSYDAAGNRTLVETQAAPGSSSLAIENIATSDGFVPWVGFVGNTQSNQVVATINGGSPPYLYRWEYADQDDYGGGSILRPDFPGGPINPGDIIGQGSYIIAVSPDSHATVFNLDAAQGNGAWTQMNDWGATRYRLHVQDSAGAAVLSHPITVYGFGHNPYTGQAGLQKPTARFTYV